MAINIGSFNREDIPFAILETFGLSQEMVDSLPGIVMKQLLQGRESPLLPITTTDENGNKQQSQARIKLCRNNEGDIDIMIIPRWRDKQLDEFREEQQRQLLLGRVIVTEISGKGECYVQYDNELRQTKFLPVSAMNHNISLITSFLNVNDDDIEKIHNGDVLEIENNGNVISFGIDLDSPYGLRLCDGNAQQWALERMDNTLPHYNFGLYGCWVKDNITNALSFVNEKDYSKEMEEEYKRSGSQNAASAKMRGLRR